MPAPLPSTAVSEEQQKEKEKQLVNYSEFVVEKMMSTPDYLYYSDHCRGLFPNKRSWELDIQERLTITNPDVNKLRIVACVALATISTISVIIVASIIFNFKSRFNGPHNKLIAFLCVLTACSCYHLVIYLIGVDTMTCYFGAA